MLSRFTAHMNGLQIRPRCGAIAGYLDLMIATEMMRGSVSAETSRQRFGQLRLAQREV
jgi:hypothetical protein